MSTETRLGQAAPLAVAMEAILAACPLVVEVEAVAEGPCEGPWCHIMPGGSLSFQASPGGLLVPVGCPILSVWPWRTVLYCSVCLAPEGSWYPLTSPGNFFWGGKRGSGCRGRAEGTEAKAPEDHLPWPPELPAPPWPPELPAPPWPPLSFCSALEVPVLCSCLCLSWGASRAPTPPPRWNCYGVGHAFQEGGVMSVLCGVCHVFPPLVSMFGLFPVLVKCHYELIIVQPCLSNYLWFTCVFIVLSVQFDLVWSTRYSPVYPVHVSLALSSLDVYIKDYNLSFLICVFLFLPRVCTVTLG